MMIDSGIGVKRAAGSSARDMVHIFFCEGSGECKLLERLNKDIKQFRCGVQGNMFKWYQIPRLRQNEFTFTPQRIQDYMMMVLNRECGQDYEDGYSYDYYDESDANKDICEYLKPMNGVDYKLYLLVDLDVFYKNIDIRRYVNLPAWVNNMRLFRGDYLESFRINSVYKFVEQELNLEDFRALFELDDVRYKEWFECRFADKKRKREILEQPNEGELGNNQRVNGEELKEKFRELYSRSNRQELTLSKRLQQAQSRVDANRGTGWPDRFGMLDVLKDVLDCKIVG